jgi:hypothetical protein
MTGDEARVLGRGDAARVALSYVALTGMLGAAVLLMKLVIAVQSLGAVRPPDF